MDLSEKETRERIIDPRLKEDAGWKEEYIRREVNCVTSNFKIKKYEIKKGEGKEEGRFIDYVLLDEHNAPLAIIEAKRFSLDAEKGSIQATTYQKDIEFQTGSMVPIFLTNGQTWFFKEKGYPTREISGLFLKRISRKASTRPSKSVMPGCINHRMIRLMCQGGWRGKRMTKKIQGIDDLELKLMPKLLHAIHKHFPEEEEKAAALFEKEVRKFHKDINDEQVLFLLFLQWFLLQYKMSNYLSVIDFLSTNPDLEFTPLDMNAIQNMQKHRTSFYRCSSISKDKKTLLLGDVLHKNREVIEVTLPKPFKKEIRKRFILAVIVKKVGGGNYLLGPALGYNEDEIPIIKKNFFGGGKA